MSNVVSDRTGTLLTEQPNPASNSLDQLSTEEVLRIINAEDRTVAAAVATQIPQIARAVDAITAAFENGGRLFYIGAGTSGRLGVLDASECTPTFGVEADVVQGMIAGGDPALRTSSEGSEDDADAGRQDLRAHDFGEQDVLVGIAASGRTPYVLGAIEEAHRIGALTVGISCTPDSALAQSTSIAITPVTGPEVVTGSTRMKAGTATKLVLNMLTTTAMVRMGYVYGNLMVNVQPRNAKLLERARRIVRDALGINESEAGRVLEAAGNDVAAAIVMARSGLDRHEANRVLAASHHRIREALRLAAAPEITHAKA